MSTYNPLVPTGTIPLNLDYKNLQRNFNQIDITYGVDHVPMTDTTNKNGYHKTIHSVPFSTAGIAPANATNQPVTSPTSVVGVSEIFTAIINDGITTASALYFQTDTGLLSQLTRNFQPSANTNGFTYLPGGIILQWGKKATSTGNQHVTFATSNMAFPNNCWCVVAVPFYNGSSTSSASQAVYIAEDTILKTRFDYVLNASSSSIKGIFWIALGN